MLRSSAPSIIAPLQQIANWPTNSALTIINILTSKQALLKENSKLRTELLLILAQLQRLDFLEQENSRLRLLLNSTEQLKTRFLAAQLLPLTANKNQQMAVDKGKADDLYVGQPIIDEHGLFGQVISVGPKTSEILPITNIKSGIPVTIVRNGMRSIANGTGHDNSLELVNTPETADIKNGDLLVTSGAGQRFPAGYKVGVVETIEHISGNRFIKILITPSAHIDTSKNVLLVWADFVDNKKIHLEK